MAEHPIPLLILSGPIGVGKSTVGDEVSVFLTRQDVPHTFVDLDALAQTFPRPADDPYGSRLALQNLADLWRNCYAAGARNIIVARVVETVEELKGIVAAIPNSRATLCHLRADKTALQDRVKKREVGSLLDWHLKRTQELALSLERTSPFDFAIETSGHTPPVIAQEIFERMNWSPLED